MSQNVGFKFEEFEIIEEEWTEINLRELNAHLTDEEFEEAQKIVMIFNILNSPIVLIETKEEIK